MAPVIRAPILTSPRPDGPSSSLIPSTFGPSVLSACRALSNQLPARNCLPLGKPFCGLSMLAGHATFGLIAKRSSMASTNCTKARLSHPSGSTRISGVFLPFRTFSPTFTRSTRCTPTRVTLTALLVPNGLKMLIGAVDDAARLAALQWRPNEHAPWHAAHSHYVEQRTQLDTLLLLHLATARAYTGGSAVTNRPCSAQPLPAPPDCERPLPPSLQPCRLRQLRKRPCTLQDLWGQGTAARRDPRRDPPQLETHHGSFRPAV